MQSVSPVFTEKEVVAEQVIALDQPEYLPIIVARIRGDEGYVASVTRYRFTAKELAAIMNGADLLIYQPHLRALMPLGLAVAMPGAYPEPEETNALDS
jgi:hypothetical protein